MSALSSVFPHLVPQAGTRSFTSKTPFFAAQQALRASKPAGLSPSSSAPQSSALPRAVPTALSRAIAHARQAGTRSPGASPSAAEPAAGPTQAGITAGGKPPEASKDVFLQLLVAQLKYQNPSAPADSTEFLAQSAMFTMVEKLEELRETQEAAGSRQRAQMGTALIGKHVTSETNDGDTIEGMVTGARFSTNGVLLVIGQKEVPIGSIVSVEKPGNEPL